MVHGEHHPRGVQCKGGGGSRFGTDVALWRLGTGQVSARGTGVCIVPLAVGGG